MLLHHFSDREDIATFVPRAPLRHPTSEPLVYAVDTRHSPMYLFPRDCPRICLWPTSETSDRDLAGFLDMGPPGSDMVLFIEQASEPSWRSEPLIRYDLDAACGFEPTGDFGYWICRHEVAPVEKHKILDVPAEMRKFDVQVWVVPSLVDTARFYFDFEQKAFTTTLHVSMIRIGLVPGWPGETGQPGNPASARPSS